MPVTASTVIAGLSGRLIGSGIQRVGSLVFQKVMRIAKIDFALKGSVIRNPAVQTAIADFETVIGSRYGQLDVPLSNFLSELQRSGIINSMVENALINRSSIELKRIFVDLHETIIGESKGEPDVLFDKMMLSFNITLKELSKDEVMFECVRLYGDEIRKRLDSVDSALGEINRTSRHAKVNFGELQANLLKFVKGLQSSNRYIRVETNKGARSVEITKIYIPPKLKYRDSKKNKQRVGAIAQVLDKYVRKVRANFTLEEQGSLERDEQVNRVTYNDLRLLFNRVVVLGDPGGGKSTLCQHLCHDLAKQAAGALQFADPKKQLTAQLQKFPIRIPLRSFEKARINDTQLSIYEFIVRDVANHVNAPEDDIRSALNYALSSGSAVLAFDGLDEILVTAQRREFVDLVVSFCNQFPLCAVIVTSRLVGYDDAPLPDDFDELVLERFDDSEVQEYSTKFMKVVGGYSEKDAQRSASQFYKQTTNNAADLRRNPLMLGLMAWLFCMRGDVPSNRPEIYRECAILMFERWDPDRNIKAEVPSDFDRLQLFSQLASKIFGHPQLSAGIETVRLEREIRIYFDEIYEDKGKAYEAAKAVIKFITGRAWVMSEVGDGIFAFTHQTFLEYFFARHLDEQTDTVEDVFDRIRPRLLKREWDMVSHLSLQIKTHRNRRLQNRALAIITELMKSDLNIKEKDAVSAFAARSLEYLAGSEAEVKNLVKEIYGHGVSSTEQTSLNDISQCTQSAQERRDFIESCLLDFLVNDFKSGTHIDRVVSLLSAAPHFNNLNRPEQILPIELKTKGREILRSFISDRVAKNRVNAQVGWQWYGIINKDIAQKFGVSIYYEYRWVQSFHRVDGLSAMALSANARYKQHFGTEEQKKVALEALSIIGAVGFSTWPLDFTSFKKIMAGNPPYSIWQALLNDLQSRSGPLAGTLFIALLVTELQRRLKRHGPEETNTKKLDDIRKKMPRSVLKNPAVRKLQIYPKIVAAIESGSLFKEFARKK
jgi:hypothetical protein